MQHAGPVGLGQLEALLAQLRAHDALRERKPGIIYWRSRAFLHFHEDPTGLYADVRLDVGGDFTRVAVNTKAEQQFLLREVARVTTR